MAYDQDLAFVYFGPTKIVFGVGRRVDVEMEMAGLGCSRALVVTDPGVMKAGLVEGVVKALGDRCVGVWSEVPQDTGVGIVNRAAAFAREAGADCVVSVGGGSVIDTGKGVCILLTEGGSLENFEGIQLLTRPQTPHIVIPTTAGTGSEVTCMAVILDERKGQKILIVEYFNTPRIAILDPKMTQKLPPLLTASTGMDAMTHAVEALQSLQREPIADGLAMQAIRLLYRHLPVCAKNGEDLAARGQVQLAATMAGWAFGNAMVGLVHAMAHSLGAIARVPHGIANGILLPHVMAFNLEMRRRDTRWSPRPWGSAKRGWTIGRRGGGRRGDGRLPPADRPPAPAFGGGRQGGGSGEGGGAQPLRRGDRQQPADGPGRGGGPRRLPGGVLRSLRGRFTELFQRIGRVREVMEEGFIENRAGELPFAGILADLLAANLTQRPEKRAVFEDAGAVAIELADIEAAVTLSLRGETPDRGGDRRKSGDRHPDDVRPGDGSQCAPDRLRAPLVLRRGGPEGPGPPVRREAQDPRDVRSPGAADAVDQDHVRHVENPAPLILMGLVKSHVSPSPGGRDHTRFPSLGGRGWRGGGNTGGGPLLTPTLALPRQGGGMVRLFTRSSILNGYSPWRISRSSCPKRCAFSGERRPEPVNDSREGFSHAWRGR